ncbi:hypothetical protein [Crocosphaera sp.]|uniref:hypothetical protein n=1 Tax=Crocosphaera sp. TaxID=2729996 RepID=UPI00260DD8B5|nr:hypothetical protein [Crocosphaera sp.]MDJ0579843.1 hypothetical protein [Crocosphaera sp.]
MLFFIIIFNLFITFINCYLLLKLWVLYNSLKKITSELINLEKQLNQLFYILPDLVLKGQEKTAELRQFYQKFLRQLAIAQKLFRNLQLLLRIWYRLENGFL